MSGKRLALAMLILLAVSAGAVLARDNGNAAGYQVVRDSANSMKLKITTDAPSEGMWLGVTLYQPNSKTGSSQIFPLRQGSNTQDVILSSSYRNGTFEAAVWSRKLSKNECEKSDELCRKTGYRLSGMVSYLWGYLN